MDRAARAARRSLPALLALAAAPVAAAVPGAGGYALVRLEPPAAATTAPGDADALAAAEAAVTAAWGPPAAGPAVRVRRCAADEGPVTPAMIEATFSRAQERFFRGDFAGAWSEIETRLAALRSGCRPASSSADAWLDPGPVQALHNVGALLLLTANDLDRTADAEEWVRRILATFAGARPADGMFPPSLADRYLDVAPDETEVGRVAVDAPGCTVNVAGRVADGAVRVLAGETPVGVRCGADAFALTLSVAAGAGVRIALPGPSVAAAPSRAERSAVLAAAAAASLAGVEQGVALETVAGGVRVAEWSAAGTARTWTIDPHDPGSVARLGDTLAAPENPAPVGGTDAGLWGAVALVAAGAALGGGGAWALVDAGDRQAQADRTATAAGRDRLAGDAATLDAAGWALVGIGAAAAAGGIVWLAVALAGGGTEAPPDGAVAALPLVGPGSLGLRLSF